ncbi:MAG: electron transport complex subunit RsxC [Tissierellaceae bacterium]|nr:electron transport complex subunit RsxC [Tissierellaceae bacterium]
MRLDNLTFKGGVHVKDQKDFTKDKSIEKALEPSIVKIPLHQHVGAPCKALVKKGDTVKVGQKIGDSEASLTVPVHSSVSGEVKGIEKLYTPDGYKVDCVIIESDGLNELDESVKPKGNLENLTKEELLDIVREAGIAGLGGAAFPLHTKLSTSLEAGVDTAILNGAECEPYLTSDHRMMLEHPEKVIYGLEVIMKYLGLNNGYIAVEDNKADAINTLKETLRDKAQIQVASLKTKFPQGDSYRVVNSVTGRIVPNGGRTKDVKTFVTNVCTATALTDAIVDGKPLYERVVTVTGNGVKEPKNLLVKIGTSIGDLIEQCGGFNGNPGKIIAGGPMTGFTQFTLDTPITKGVTGIIVLTEAEAAPSKTTPCIKCGKCVEVCPAFLQPLTISAYSLKDRYENAEAYNALACIECGSCSYICPAKRPLTESIAHAKRQITARRKKS